MGTDKSIATPDALPGGTVFEKLDLPLFKPSIPGFEDLKPFYDEISGSGYQSNFGPISRRFEDALAALLGVEYVLALSNLSTGIMYMPRAAGLTDGEVICPSFSFLATAHSMLLGGLTPVFADVDRETLTLCPQSVEAAITENTVAVLGMHTYGNPCDIAALEKICDRHGLVLLFDAAHGLGAKYQGRRLGSFGLAEGFSTSATKIFSTLGEGGFIATDDASFAENIRYMRNWGHLGDYNARMPSIVSKLPELSAAAGLLELEKLEGYCNIRQELAAFAQQQLGEIPGIRFPLVRPGDVCGFKDFTIIIDEDFPMTRDMLSQVLAACGVQSRKYFSPSIHQTVAYEHMPVRVPLDNTIEASAKVISLPMFNHLKLSEMERMCKLIADIAANPAEAEALIGE